MRDNPFDDLLREFQAAYAKYGQELFFLAAVTGEEWRADREQIDKMAGCLGFVPVGDDCNSGSPGYYIFAPLYKHRRERWVGRWEEPFRTFEDLAARAGAALPLSVRNAIPYPPAEPATWWLAYMWWQKPPSEDHLSPPDGKTKITRVIWAEPFLEAVEAIERGELCTPDERTGADDVPTGQQARRTPAGRRQKRGKQGAEKWRKALDRMLDLLKNDKLPSSLRQAQRLLESDGFRASTVRTAAHKSDFLKAHFDLQDDAQPPTSGNLLDELTQQADKRTQQLISEMTPNRRQEAEDALRKIRPARRVELLQALAKNPDAGSAGDVSLIENADQDSRADDDWSG